jgi:hypothetical protein
MEKGLAQSPPIPPKNRTFIKGKSWLTAIFLRDLCAGRRVVSERCTKALEHVWKIQISAHPRLPPQKQANGQVKQQKEASALKARFNRFLRNQIVGWSDGRVRKSGDSFLPPGLAGSGRRKPTHEWVLFSSVPGGTGTSIHLTPSKDRVGNKGGLRRSFIRERGAAEPPSNEQDHESQHRQRRIRKPDAPSKQAQPNHEDCRGDERKLEVQEL